MKDYVFVLKTGNSLRIGRKTYTQEEVQKRLDELKSVGINNMVAMHVDEAFGN